MIEYQKISNKYVMKVMEENDIENILSLCKGNPVYYDYMNEELTEAYIKKSMTALPPEKMADDKYYLGFYHLHELVAIMELVFEYPDSETVLLGFFMVDSKFQGSGIGSDMINEFSEFVEKLGYKHIILSYVEGNEQSRRFWEKNNFIPTGEVDEFEDITMITLIKSYSKLTK